MNTNLVIPSQIPWDRLKGRDLEECLYWLLDSMGAKDLEWRLGGKGAGSSDGGRDLECSFYMSSPEEDLALQRWWIESKGRTDTVEPIEVKEAVLNAAGKTEIDVLVIATNTQFSNPTPDWVKQWQEDRPRPRIRLWERTTLERLCSKHPTVVIRLFSEALSEQGLLEVTRSRMWNHAFLSDEPTLKRLWKNRESLEWDPQSLFSVIVSECGNGDICARPWGTIVGVEDLVILLANGLLNTPGLVFRATNVGSKQTPFMRALSYLILVALDTMGTKALAQFLDLVWELVEGRTYSLELRELILGPALRTLVSEVRDVCVSSCSRVHGDRIALQEDEIDRYWDRLLSCQDAEVERKEPKKSLTIESYTDPCEVGFVVDREKWCPICHLEHPEKNVPAVLEIVEKIIEKRKSDSGEDN